MSDPAGGAAPFELQGGLAHRLARLGFLALAMVVWVRTAWLCDDAFITLRHVDHLTQGHGPFFNLDERVIGFTHPLWFFALAPVWWASASAAVTLFLVPFVFTAATLWMLSTKLAPSATRVMLAGALLLSSRAFVDWSSSGLENPLSHLLVVALVLETLGRLRLLPVSLIAALLGLTHPELLLAAVPPLVLAWRRRPSPLRGKVLTVAAGLSPLAGWVAFTLIWTGSVVPNTAMAKLPANLGTGELLRQGVLYLLSSLVWDPATLFVIALAFFSVGACARRRALAIGAVLVLGAVVRVGGDFMNGRFLTPVLVLAVALIVTSHWIDAPRVTAGVGLLVLVVGLHSSHLWRQPWGAAEEGRLIDPRGVADERAWYGKWTNLTLARRDRPIPRRELVKNISAQWDGKGRIAVAEAVGILAWYAGSGVHVVDRNGLTDPLLARLPFERQDTWRPGHLARALPDGYRETLDSGTSAIADPCVAALWKDVAMATRSPLTTDGRAAAIWRLLVHDSRGPQAAYPEACPAAASP